MAQQVSEESREGPELLSDTDPKIRARQLEMLRRLTPERRLEITFDLCQMVRDLAREGVRMRYPNATEAQQKRHFADVILGPELAMKVYGPHEKEDSQQCNPKPSS